MLSNPLELESIERLFSQLQSSQTQFDVFRSLREITSHFSYRFFSVNGVMREGFFSLSQMVVISSAPSDLIMHHRQFDFSISNAISGKPELPGAPFEFRATPKSCEADANACRIARLMQEYDLDCWVVIPVFTPRWEQCAISYLGNRNAISTAELAHLSLVSSQVQAELHRVSAKDKAPVTPLTDRELECLVWTAAGKTSVEIARILVLSEHTVNHYLNNATRKCGTVNRTQTVAFALRNGWIE